MSIFSIIDGSVKIKRPPKPLGYFYIEGAYSTPQTFDFGAVRKDIYLECDQPITVKLNDAGSAAISLGPGVWHWTEEWANKMLVSFAVSTNLKVYANG